jgi:molybdate transport system regulatory protein
MKLKLKVNLENGEGEPFMGIGLVWLLREIDACHSIHEAAERLDLSYVKALKILNRLEANVPEPVLLRRRGGHERGGAELTEYGQALVTTYDAMQGRLKACGEQEFMRFKRELRALVKKKK